VLLRYVATIFDRDLRILRREIEAYTNDRQLWQPVPGMVNTAGTLVLHMTGNLQHYLGAKLGGSGYVRDRPAEFARRDVPRTELLLEVEAARAAVAATLAGIGDDPLPAEYPETIGDVRVSTEEYLIHLVGHFAYHLGQLDTHRRIVTGNLSGVGAIRAAELGTARPASG
jgi:uncharacterized damage-inducible protein DinB